MIVKVNGQEFTIYAGSIEIEGSNGSRYLVLDAYEEGLIVAVVTESYSCIAVRPQSGNAVRVREDSNK